jgi:hypothetical protein
MLYSAFMEAFNDFAMDALKASATMIEKVVYIGEGKLSCFPAPLCWGTLAARWWTGRTVWWESSPG